MDGMDAHSLCRMQYSVCSRKEMQEKQIAVKDHRKSLKEKKKIVKASNQAVTPKATK